MDISTNHGRSTETAATSQPIRRYITGHDHAVGESIYVDTPELEYFPVPGFGTAARSYATTKLAAELADDEDLKEHLSHDSVAGRNRRDFTVPPTKSNPQTGEIELGGANVINLDLDPGAVGHMHRTVSLDISTCVMGEVYHELDSGQKVLLKAGVSPDVALVRRKKEIFSTFTAFIRLN
ncbi:hypothetical protein NM208_g5792 [Fusarium decemcellulare]|uniref:Uncharacterized protein n=1 Tax=Fusarium decemcellulare TaxID=57161 RepID=A0ACC1SFT7_9HYPO|nr:hypothetical protein NM208_g5792 [Fusarium decemcellulare]